MKTVIFAIYYDEGRKKNKITRIIDRIEHIPNYKELEEIEEKYEKSLRWDNVRIFNICEITDCGELPEQ